ncbi:AraC family transcriptional regulator [Blastomonas fulva]|uniref:AraC family transcriptional regulator n=1 Tax=Blastomonas fulva TaxID=1550728 RepID=UPI003F71A4E1
MLARRFAIGNKMPMSDTPDLARIIARNTPQEGVFQTLVPGLSLIRADDPGMPMPTVYEPSLCIIAQGAKTVSLGAQTLHYDDAHCLVAGVDLALIGQVTAASPDHPYLCCKIDIDQTVLADLIAADGNALPPGNPPPLAVHPIGPELLDASTRLLHLLDRPHSIPVLAPLVQREILYHLLNGPQGAMLRHAASGDCHLGQVSRAIGWIRHHSHEQLRIRDVAGAARMSISSLHHHFKRITGLTPLQFQKQLRLQAARQMMIAEGINAGSAGFAVGYDSPSQFSREYRRLFGAPPRADISGLN